MLQAQDQLIRDNQLITLSTPLQAPYMVEPCPAIALLSCGFVFVC